MEILNPDWNFNSVYQVESSSRLNRKFLFKITLQLNVKISTRYTEYKSEQKFKYLKNEKGFSDERKKKFIIFSLKQKK